MNRYSKVKKFELKHYIALVVAMILLCTLLLTTGSWFTGSKNIVGELARPKINPQLTVNGIDNQDTSLIIDSSSKLSTTIAFKFTDTNVENIVARANVSVEIGKMVGGNFVKESLGNVTSLVTVNYESNWTRGKVPSEDALINMGINPGITCFTYHYYSNLLTSTSNVTIATGFTDSTNLLGQGYVFKVYVSCETAVAGDLLFGESNVGGLWTEENAQGTAPTSWIDSIKTKI